MDRKLLDLLVCPVSKRQPLPLLRQRAARRPEPAHRRRARSSRCAGARPSRVGEALVTRDRKIVYRIDDGIPVLLADEAIATAQFGDFPR